MTCVIVAVVLPVAVTATPLTLTNLPFSTFSSKVRSREDTPPLIPDPIAVEDSATAALKKPNALEANCVVRLPRPTELLDQPNALLLEPNALLYRFDAVFP